MKGILFCVKNDESDDKYLSAMLSTDEDTESEYIKICLEGLRSRYDNDETRELCLDRNIELKVKIVNFEITNEEEVFALN